LAPELGERRLDADEDLGCVGEREAAGKVEVHVRLLVKCFRLKPHPVHTQYTPQTIRRDDHEFAEYPSFPS